jgi:hypothetical protein
MKYTNSSHIYLSSAFVKLFKIYTQQTEISNFNENTTFDEANILISRIEQQKVPLASRTKARTKNKHAIFKLKNTPSIRYKLFSHDCIQQL